jgi:large subunit ribosomal protein L23
MALLDFLKRKKEIEKAKPVKKTDMPAHAGKASVATPAKKVQKKETQEPSALSKSSGASKKGFSYQIIKEPHISEKASNLAEKNKYTFKVYTNTNKPEIKKSVEGIYGVNVLDVKVIKVPKKKRRLGRTEGFKKGFKKAVVTIKEGQKIEIF